jgi:hypothetical protein
MLTVLVLLVLPVRSNQSGVFAYAQYSTVGMTNIGSERTDKFIMSAFQLPTQMSIILYHVGDFENSNTVQLHIVSCVLLVA